MVVLSFSNSSMKLYATVTSERDSRPAKKGGDQRIEIELMVGNKRVGIIILTESLLILLKGDGTHELTKHL